MIVLTLMLSAPTWWLLQTKGRLTFFHASLGRSQTRVVLRTRARLAVSSQGKTFSYKPAVDMMINTTKGIQTSSRWVLTPTISHSLTPTTKVNQVMLKDQWLRSSKTLLWWTSNSCQRRRRSLAKSRAMLATVAVMASASLSPPTDKTPIVE